MAQDPFWQNNRQRRGGEEDKSLTAKWRVEGRKKLFFTVGLIVGTEFEARRASINQFKG